MKLVNNPGEPMVRLVRKSDGVAVLLPVGADVTIIDDKGSSRLKNGYAKPGDEIVKFEGELYFVARGFLA